MRYVPIYHRLILVSIESLVFRYLHLRLFVLLKPLVSRCLRIECSAAANGQSFDWSFPTYLAFCLTFGWCTPLDCSVQVSSCVAMLPIRITSFLSSRLYHDTKFQILIALVWHGITFLCNQSLMLWNASIALKFHWIAIDVFLGLFLYVLRFSRIYVI